VAGVGVIERVDERRRTKIQRALHRPKLFMGGERELVLSTGAIALGGPAAILTLPSVIFGIIVWSLLIGALRRMAKVDPMMSKVYLRNRRYRDFYPANSRPFRSF